MALPLTALLISKNTPFKRRQTQPKADKGVPYWPLSYTKMKRLLFLCACLAYFFTAFPLTAQTTPKHSRTMTKKKITIYQVLPRTYTNASTTNIENGSKEENGVGKMNDFTPELLNRIREQGYTHLWYTGLLEHATQTDYSAYGIRKDNAEVVKGRAGSPYAVKDYFDIDPDLAVDVPKRIAEFKALLKRTHKAKLRFVMDFIPNHVAREYFSDNKPAGLTDLGEGDNPNLAFSPQNNFYYFPNTTLHLDSVLGHPGTYVESPAKATGNDRFSEWPERNDWYETIKLNYGVDYLNNRSEHFSPLPSTWEKMTNILLYWASFGVDAFRCDMAEMVPVAFWEYAIKRVKAEYPKVEFIAEIYNPNEYRNYIHRGGFDYLYNKVGLYDSLRAVIRGEQSASCITARWQEVDDIRDNMLNFLENHDEQRIASPFFAGSAEKARPAFVVSALLDRAATMVYGGQEVGEKGMDKEGFSGEDGRTTIFDYWGVKGLQALQRQELSLEERQLYDFYQRIVCFARDNKAIAEGESFDLMYVNPHSPAFNPDKQYAFLRKQGRDAVLVVANFDNEARQVEINIPQHAFDFLKLRSGTKTATDILTDAATSFLLSPTVPVTITVPANNATVLHFKN